MKTWKANNAAVVNENGDMICMCHNKGHDITHEDMMENVKLIAAAPKLLDTLKCLKDSLITMVGQKTAESMWAYHDAIRIIDKAEG